MASEYPEEVPLVDGVAIKYLVTGDKTEIDAS